MSGKHSKVERLEPRRMLASALLKDIYVGNSGSSPRALTTVGQDVYFFADDLSGTGLYKSNGTPAGTTRITTAYSPTYNESYKHTATATQFFYAGKDSNGHDQFFHSNGTPAGTESLTDNINFDITWSNYTRTQAIAPTKIVFSAPISSEPDLYVTDGTIGGTTLLKDLFPGEHAQSPRWMTLVGSEVYFTTGIATGALADTELWRTDGTPTGTVPVATFSADHQLSNFVSSGSKLYFLDKSASGWSLDSYNGTTLTNLTSGIDFTNGPFSAPQNFSLASAGNKLYFTALHNTIGTALWQSDGTAAGTTIVPGQTPATITGIWQVTALQDGVAFYQSDSSGLAIRQFHPSMSAPQKMTDAASAAGALVAADDVIYFQDSDVDHGNELWRTDGTPGGTARVADDTPGPDGNYIDLSNSVALGRSLVYVNYDAQSGYEPRRAPVTEAATVQYEYHAHQQVVVTFADPITPGSLQPEDLTLTRSRPAVAPVNIPSTQLAISFNPTNTVATITYTGAANGVLPDGNYALSIGTGAFTNTFNTPNFQPAQTSFFTLAGDTNQNRSVDLADLVTLSQHWNSAVTDYAFGDFNYDHTVDLSDLVILSQNWNQHLDQAPPVQVPVAAPLQSGPS